MIARYEKHSTFEVFKKLRAANADAKQEIEDLLDRGAAPGLQVFNFGRLDYPDFWFRGET